MPREASGLRQIRCAVCVIDVRQNDSNTPVVLINPEITKRSGRVFLEEGCLSFPGITANIKRHKKIQVTALNADGMPVEFEAEELFSRAIQHEIDHLKGIVFLDRLPLLKRLSAVRNHKKLAAAEGKAKKQKKAGIEL